ncbi:ABC1 kinase family protein [Clostridium sp. Cult2]|uniref:ABC1 kinase family protein n=1 Tax=Clostridium sp. Cult2 TaxID=2079003 RepID=UPI001F27CC0E|nr:AarF/UbiB family protein [Clostridium sp. Cult2]MCF6466576.1 ABC transporter [Clostridium sp. Cult2]
MDNDYSKKRFREIISVALKHGFKNGIGEPKELRLFLEELGPSFVKIGQILSTRADIIPIEYINELQKLQDDVSPEEFIIMKEVIEFELKGSIDEVFMDFIKTPIASASLSEVYLAKLKTGERVVVKVQRPFVKEKMLSDIKILKKLAPFINFTTTGEVVDMKKVADELSTATKKELNFIEEMNNIIKFTENNLDVKFMTVPKVYAEYCTPKVLVMDYISGIKIDNTGKLKEKGYDIHDIATKITYNYFKQVFEDGFFHADPHPGNILIYENTISYIDFGLMGSLNSSLKKNLNDFLEGASTKDIDLMTKSILKIGIKKGPIDLNRLYRDIEILYSTYIDEAIHDYDIPQILEEVILVCKKNNINMPHNITLLIKGMITLQAVLAKIDRNITLMDIALPYFKNQIIKEKFKNLDFTEMAAFLYSSFKSTFQLSTKVIDIINTALEGRLKLNLELKNMEENFNEINKMVNRLIFAIIVAGLLVSSSLVINANVGLKIYGISSIGIVGYLGAGVAGLLLLISIVKSGKL